MGETIVSSSKVDSSLHSPTTGGGPQDSVGLTLPVSPYFIQMASNDSSQVQVMIKISQGFGWHEVVVLRQDTEYHKRFALSLEVAFLGAKIKIVSNVSLSESAKDLEIQEQLDKLKAIQTRVFLVYMVPSLRSRLFLLAKTVGIMNEGYTWLIMDSLSNTSKSFQYNNLDSGEVVLPMRDSPPRSNGRTHFKSECEKLFSWIESEKATIGDTPAKWKACIPRCSVPRYRYFLTRLNLNFSPLVDHNYETRQNYNDMLTHLGQSHNITLQAFPFGYRHVPEFSRAVVSLSESKTMQDLMKKYHMHDYSSDDQASQVPAQTPPLRAHSFIGLFILAGVGTIGTVLASEYALWQRRSVTVEMTNDSEYLPNVDNQEHPPPVSIPSDGEILIEESDEGQENAEVFPSREVPH
ncbi:hypothetical protein RJ640_006223 [Escallonia rubra]|uniref:Receptor ligand binding region domain-containing protein n=1 Tax=Escallonia rubra TaxID=112253 RepID=A0AA88R2P4_9ASTE|nr:hypothetical protein RJ640_006223 [Escallonia rubra]